MRRSQSHSSLPSMSRVTTPRMAHSKGQPSWSMIRTSASGSQSSSRAISSLTVIVRLRPRRSSARGSARTTHFHEKESQAQGDRWSLFLELSLDSFAAWLAGVWQGREERAAKHSLASSRQVRFPPGEGSNSPRPPSGSTPPPCSPHFHSHSRWTCSKGPVHAGFLERSGAADLCCGLDGPVSCAQSPGHPASREGTGGQAAVSSRSGRYTSPVSQSRCSKTASFRATAATARRLPFLPPEAACASPHRRRSQSGPKCPRM